MIDTDRQQRLEQHARRIRAHQGWDKPDPDEQTDDHPVPLDVRLDAADELRRWLYGGAS